MNTCPKCQQPLTVGKSPQECPRCLLSLALTETPQSNSAAEASGHDRTKPLPTPGDRLRYLGDYELLEEIARGGMGVVFKARQHSLNRIVAVKMILTGRLAGAAEIQRFRIEAEAAARLKHPGIVAIHEIGEHEGNHYFSMDYVEGRNLAEVVAESGPIGPLDAATMLKAIAEAVDYAHQQGTLHRDLKPHNIVIDTEGKPHVTDFGLAKLIQTQHDMTRTGTLLGTPAYMSPEQASAQWKMVGPLSDIYALGAVLYFALTGRPPFIADDPVSLLRSVIEKLPEPPRKLIALVPQELENICLRALEKEPSRRYASAADLAQDLNRFIQGEPVLARRPGRAIRTVGWFRRHSWIAKAILALAFVGLGCLAYGLWEKTQFLIWIKDHPDYKPDPEGAEKRLERIFGVISFLIFAPALFLDFMKRNYLQLVRAGKYARVLYSHAAIGMGVAAYGLWAFGSAIREHVWHGTGLGYGMWFWAAFLATMYGPISWFTTRKELNLLRLGQTPEEGFSPEEYQQLIEIHWSRSKERTRELVRAALLKGDRKKALAFAEAGSLGKKLTQLEYELSAQGLLPEIAPPPPKPVPQSRNEEKWWFVIGTVFLIAGGFAFIQTFQMLFPEKPRREHDVPTFAKPSPHPELFQIASTLQARGTNAIPQLLQMLRGENAEERSIAAQVLGRLGPQVSPVLLGELRDQRPNVRCWAALSLGLLRIPGPLSPSETWKKALLELAQDKNPAVRTAAGFCLLGMPPSSETANALASILETTGLLEVWSSWFHIQDAEQPVLKICELHAYGLGVRTIAVAHRQLTSTPGGYIVPASVFFDLKVIDAFEDLFHRPDVQFIPLFTRLLSSPVRHLRSKAASALAAIGAPAVKALINILEEGDATAQENAAFALGRIGTQAVEAVPALLQLLRGQQLSDDAHCHPCAAAVFALSAIKTNTAAGLLELLRSDNRTASRYAAAALGKLTGSESVVVGPLSEALSDNRWHVRAGAALALGELGAAAGAAPPVPEISSGARRQTFSLEFSARDAVPELLYCARDPDARVARHQGTSHHPPVHLRESFSSLAGI